MCEICESGLCKKLQPKICEKITFFWWGESAAFPQPPVRNNQVLYPAVTMWIKRAIMYTTESARWQILSRLYYSTIPQYNNIVLGAPAQDLPKFQMPFLTLEAFQTCSIHSPDGNRKVLLKKIDPFMTNGCPIVAPPDVTSDWLMTDSWLAV